MRWFCGCLALAAACGGGGESVQPKPPKQLAIVNYLNEAAAIKVDGVAYGTVDAGTTLGPATSTIVLPGSARTLLYTMRKRTYSDGSPVADDLDGESLTLVDGDATLGLNNVVAGQPYFSFGVSNATGKSIEICLVRDGVTTDLGSITPPTGLPIPALYGYYRFTPTTEVREYRAGACTGTFRSWSNTTISGFGVNNGLVFLLADVAP